MTGTGRMRRRAPWAALLLAGLTLALALALIACGGGDEGDGDDGRRDIAPEDRPDTLIPAGANLAIDADFASLWDTAQLDALLTLMGGEEALASSRQALDETLQAEFGVTTAQIDRLEYFADFNAVQEFNGFALFGAFDAAAFRAAVSGEPAEYRGYELWNASRHAVHHLASLDQGFNVWLISETPDAGASTAALLNEATLVGGTYQGVRMMIDIWEDAANTGTAVQRLKALGGQTVRLTLELPDAEAMSQQLAQLDYEAPPEAETVLSPLLTAGLSEQSPLWLGLGMSGQDDGSLRIAQVSDYADEATADAARRTMNQLRTDLQGFVVPAPEITAVLDSISTGGSGAEVVNTVTLTPETIAWLQAGGLEQALQPNLAAIGMAGGMPGQQGPPLIPQGADLALHADLNALLNSPALQELLSTGVDSDAVMDELTASLHDDLGITLEQVQYLEAFSSMETPEEFGGVALRGDFDPAAYDAAVAQSAGSSSEYRGVTLWAGEADAETEMSLSGALELGNVTAMLNPQTVLAGTETAVKAMIDVSLGDGIIASHLVDALAAPEPRLLGLSLKFPPELLEAMTAQPGMDGDPGAGEAEGADGMADEAIPLDPLAGGLGGLFGGFSPEDTFMGDLDITAISLAELDDGLRLTQVSDYATEQSAMDAQTILQAQLDSMRVFANQMPPELAQLLSRLVVERTGPRLTVTVPLPSGLLSSLLDSGMPEPPPPAATPLTPAP